ncbi:trace amine-associated receptor 5-like [Cimex lectularius]|uniref:G-protein coupled receptors family 1 profile domain-containing protein n=1 Tax=Cimex lectularius TaxID=79782 RepID=A0A8I6SJC9_CIMLE|nr:trace amine-associated receptor 5-like [Cimex lectularius]XP_024084330.1 trace amine-associated receptor 5-like [Cimex lectularius]
MRSLDTKGTLLVAPLLHNSSCTKAHNHVTAGSVVQAAFILLLSAGIFLANLLVILVVNSRRYSKYIHQQPRYLLTSLASNDLAIGVLVTPFGFLPALFRCWPYSETLCQIQVISGFTIVISPRGKYIPGVGSDDIVININSD